MYKLCGGTDLESSEVNYMGNATDTNLNRIEKETLGLHLTGEAHHHRVIIGSVVGSYPGELYSTNQTGSAKSYGRKIPCLKSRNSQRYRSKRLIDLHRCGDHRSL